MLDKLKELTRWYDAQIASINSEYYERIKKLQEQYAREKDGDQGKSK